MDNEIQGLTGDLIDRMTNFEKQMHSLHCRIENHENFVGTALGSLNNRLQEIENGTHLKGVFL